MSDSLKGKPGLNELTPDGLKICRSCRKPKPLTHVYWQQDSRNSGGFRHSCKDCLHRSRARIAKRNRKTDRVYSVSDLGNKVYLNLPTDCPTCRGFAYVQDKGTHRWYPCSVCLGSGRNDIPGTRNPLHCVRDGNGNSGTSRS